MPVRRTVLLAAALLVVAATAFGITRIDRKVEVVAGTRVMCTYGHEISSDVRKISVSARKAGLYGVKTETRVCDKHARAEALYEEAQAALAKRDVKTAKTKLQEVVETDASIGNAKQQLADIDKDKTPKPDGGDPTPSGDDTSSPEPDGGTGGAANLTQWVPSVLDGFTAGKPLVESMGVTRVYYPSNSDEFVQLTIVAEQFKTPKGAENALQEKVKGSYTLDATTLTINGRSVYYGAKGSVYVAVGFTQGGVMVAAELAARPGTQPSNAKALLVRVVEQLP